MGDHLPLCYGGMGVTMVVAFGLCRGKKHEKFLQLICLLIINSQIPGRRLMLGDYAFSIQNLATLALLPIWCYNGTAGRKTKLLQYSAYLFYPAHLCVLVLLRRFL